MTDAWARRSIEIEGVDMPATETPARIELDPVETVLPSRYAFGSSDNPYDAERSREFAKAQRAQFEQYAREQIAQRVAAQRFAEREAIARQRKAEFANVSAISKDIARDMWRVELRCPSCSCRLQFGLTSTMLAKDFRS